MELVYVAQLLPPQFRSIFLIILPQNGFFPQHFLLICNKIHFITMIFNA